MKPFIKSRLFSRNIILLFTCSTLFKHSLAQLDIYVPSYGNVYTHTGAEVGIFGNIINDAAGGLNHNNGGDIYLYRRAANGTGNSRIYDGPGAPAPTGNYNAGGAYVRFWNLLTDNNTGTATPSGTPINGAGGSGQISIEQECRISGLHSFVNGMVWTPRNNWQHAYVHYDNNASSYTGTSDLRHIDGYAARSGSSDFDFPIGDGTRLRMSGLRSPANGIFKSAYFNKDATLGTTGISGNIASSGPAWGNIVLIDRTEFWDIDGTASSNFMLTALNSVAGYSDWNSVTNFFASNPGKVVITGFDPWENLGISPIASSITQDGQFVTTTATTPDGNFSAYTWALTNIVLPIRFNKFNSAIKDCHILLTWEVENEYGVMSHEVQRSDNGSSYYPIATIPTGNSAIYSYTADQPGVVSYYRIKLKYSDGSYKYGPVLPVEKICSGVNILSLKAYPNPFRANLQLILTSDKQSVYQIMLTNLSGQPFINKVIHAETGNNLISLDGNNLLPGNYFVQLYDTSGSKLMDAIKIIKISR